MFKAFVYWKILFLYRCIGPKPLVQFSRYISKKQLSKYHKHTLIISQTIIRTEELSFALPLVINHLSKKPWKIEVHSYANSNFDNKKTRTKLPLEQLIEIRGEKERRTEYGREIIKEKKDICKRDMKKIRKKEERERKLYGLVTYLFNVLFYKLIFIKIKPINELL